MSADPENVHQAFAESVTPEMYKQWKQICDFLGTPRVMPTMTQLRSKDVWDYFEMFTGPQTEMSEAVHKDFKKNVVFPLDVFEMETVTGDSFAWIHFLLESQVMDESTEQMPNTILEATKVQNTAHMQSKGMSFVMNADFIFSDEGIDLFHQYCKGLEKCVANTLGDDVLTEIRKAAVLNHLEGMSHPQNKEQFHRVLQSLVSKFAIFQKQRDGVSIVQSEAFEALDQLDIQADLEIGPQGFKRYQEYNDPQRNTASLGGDNLLPKSFETDHVVQYVKQFPKIRSQQSRTYKQTQNQVPRDPFYRTVVVGGHTVSRDIVTPAIGVEKYRSSYRDVTIGDSRKVTARKTLMEINRNSMIWHPNGEITEKGEEILQAILGDSVAKPYTVDKLFRQAKIHSMVTAFCSGDSADGKSRYAKYLAKAKDEVGADVPDVGNAVFADGAAAPAEVKAQGMFDHNFTLRVAEALIESDLPLPIGFILSRSQQTMVAGSYVQCASKGAGRIVENRWMMDLMKNTKQRKLGVNLNYSAKCIIKKRENFVFMPDVFVRNISHGMGTSFYGPDDLTDSSSRTVAGSKDIHVLAVPYNFELDDTWNDITGAVHEDMLQLNQHSPQKTYPTADVYMSIWGWTNTPTNLFQQAYWTPVPGEYQFNTLTLQEWQRYAIPKELDTGVSTVEIDGHHWIGQKIYPSTYRALRGEDSFMTQAIYEPKQVVVN